MTQKLHTRVENERENLIAGNIEMPTATEVLKMGVNYKRGQVLGFINPENKCVPVNKGATDTSHDVYAILAEDADATNADVVAAVYYAGKFNKNSVIFSNNDTVVDHKLSARKVGIFFI